jgi:hypothetical protein
MTEQVIAPPVKPPRFEEIRPTFTPAQEKAFKKLTPAQKKQLREQGLMWGLIAADAAPGGTQSLLQVFLQAAEQGILDGTAASQTALQRLIKQSAWGRKHTETQEAFLTLKYTYPEEYDKLMNGTTITVNGKQQRVGGWIDWVKNTAAALGGEVSDQEAIGLAESINMDGLSTQQAEKFMLGFVDFEQADLVGKAGQAQDAINNYARQFGLNLTPKQTSTYVQDYLFGKTQLSDVVDTFRRDSAKQYTNFSDRIMAGETVDDVLSPYKTMAKQLLEVDDIDLNDNLMLDTLSGRTADGKAKYSSLSDFKRAIKSDPRWQQTNNARSEYFNIGQRILKDFGFLG